MCGAATDDLRKVRKQMSLPPHRYSQVHELLRSGSVHEALQRAQEFVRSAPHDPRALKLLGDVLKRAGRTADALALLERATIYAPGQPAYLLHYGQALAASGRRRDALAIATRLAGLPLSGASTFDALGTLYAYCDEPLHASHMFARAVAGAPTNSDFLYNLATAQRMVGKLEEAESTLDQVIAAKPGDYGAYYTRSDLRTQTADRNHVAELKGVLNTPGLPRAAQISLWFALAKELEDTAAYAESFEYLKRGCDAHRNSMSYSVADDVETIDQLIRKHGPTPVEGGLTSQEPIFVIGLPRSGTTLVERILGAHSQIHAAGELDAFQREIVRSVAIRSGGRRISKLEFVERSLEIEPAELGRAYIEATRPQTGRTPRFVDKTPLNYLYVSLIRRALPNARIILVLRDPMDSCYAMYKTLFSAAYPFTYNLSELAIYYRAWRRLMNHWETVAGDSLLVLHYEELVADVDSVGRRMIAHCGLQWEEACLSFHSLQLPVSTASAVQVRKPVYATSIGKWRHYAAQLDELRRKLDGPAPLPSDLQN
jgi:tetratricopeptide (TPR) repeat protein